MINVLPLNHILEIDQPIFGANLFNLSRLAREGLPTLPGIAVAPPEIVIQTLLRQTEHKDKEVFEQKLELVRHELNRIPVPEEIKKEVKKYHNFYLEGEIIKGINNLWGRLISIWLNEIRSKVWREGFAGDLNSSLSAQTIIFICKNFFSATGYFDSDRTEVIISSAGKIDPGVAKQIDEMVSRANKKLIIPQIYYLAIITQKPYLIGVSPFTQSLPLSKATDLVLPQKQQNKVSRCATKLFLNLSCGLAEDSNIDGAILDADKINCLGDWRNSFDDMVFKISQSALSFHNKPVIFKFPDVSDGDIRGTLRLLNQKNLLSHFVDIFLFVRNKKNLLNIELGIPQVRMPDEYNKIKQELASKGINRYGKLKFWLEMCVPENLINIEDYLAVGLDGIILDLDNLQKYLGGYSPEEGEFYKKEIAALIKFISPAFKILHKAGVPVLIKGELAIHPDVLNCLIENGVWGIVVNTPLEAESLPEHLNWAERKMVSNRLRTS